MAYRRYHSSVKLAAAAGTLDASIAEQIPSSTLYRFTSGNYSDLFGIPDDAAETIELTKAFAKSKTAQHVFRAMLVVKRFVVSVLSEGRVIAHAFSRRKARLVRLVDRVKHTIGESRVLRILRLTKRRFTRWKNEVVKRCPVSIRSLCLRTHPGQLSQTEIRRVKQMMHDKRYHGWPIHAIHAKGVRDGFIGFARSTFYKYTKLLGLSHSTGRSRRKDHTPGIRASRPNELWHADVTVFRTLDRVLCYIYFVVDNFSRRILAWNVDSSANMKTHRETVLDAYRLYGTEDTNIMTDGGSENGNYEGIPLKHIIAGKDVLFSNSLVEAVNKVVKYQSLYLQDIPDMPALLHHLSRYVPIYNDERPHSAHGYHTPTEVHEERNPYPDGFRSQFEAARQDRITANQTEACPICPPKRVSA